MTVSPAKKNAAAKGRELPLQRQTKNLFCGKSAKEVFLGMNNFYLTIELFLSSRRIK